jgi:ubiquinone/menaquinone biosynthesis C-methylase UbiE
VIGNERSPLNSGPKAVVAAGYDRIAETYLEWSVDHRVRMHWLGKLEAMLKSNARVLDLGCGAGIPVAQHFMEIGFEVLGVDASERQILLARERVPKVSFIHGDMTQIEFEAHSFDAVIAFYSITHVPREFHAELFRDVRIWLKPGGMFVTNLGHHDEPGWIGEWLGTQMFFSHFDVATNVKLLGEAGFEILQSESIGEVENGAEVKFLWVIAQS